MFMRDRNFNTSALSYTQPAELKYYFLDKKDSRKRDSDIEAETAAFASAREAIAKQMPIFDQLGKELEQKIDFEILKQALSRELQAYKDDFEKSFFRSKMPLFTDKTRSIHINNLFTQINQLNGKGFFNLMEYLFKENQYAKGKNGTTYLLALKSMYNIMKSYVTTETQPILDQLVETQLNIKQSIAALNNKQVPQVEENRLRNHAK